MYSQATVFAPPSFQDWSVGASSVFFCLAAKMSAASLAGAGLSSFDHRSTLSLGDLLSLQSHDIRKQFRVRVLNLVVYYLLFLTFVQNHFHLSSAHKWVDLDQAAVLNASSHGRDINMPFVLTNPLDDRGRGRPDRQRAMQTSYTNFEDHPWFMWALKDPIKVMRVRLWTAWGTPQQDLEVVVTGKQDRLEHPCVLPDNDDQVLPIVARCPAVLADAIVIRKRCSWCQLSIAKTAVDAYAPVKAILDTVICFCLCVFLAYMATEATDVRKGLAPRPESDRRIRRLGAGAFVFWTNLVVGVTCYDWYHPDAAGMYPVVLRRLMELVLFATLWGGWGWCIFRFLNFRFAQQETVAFLWRSLSAIPKRCYSALHSTRLLLYGWTLVVPFLQYTFLPDAVRLVVQVIRTDLTTPQQNWLLVVGWGLALLILGLFLLIKSGVAISGDTHDIIPHMASRQWAFEWEQWRPFFRQHAQNAGGGPSDKGLQVQKVPSDGRPHHTAETSKILGKLVKLASDAPHHQYADLLRRLRSLVAEERKMGDAP